MSERTDVRLDGIEAAVAAIAAGRPVLVVDDPGRENEADLIVAAEHATPRTIGFMIRHTSGVVCAPVTDAIADRLALPPMCEHNQDRKQTAYTVSCDAATGVTTGITATERAHTIRVIADPAAGPDDLTRPGHVFPLRAKAGGVLERAGHTEAAVDLARLAGLASAGAISELVDDEGEVVRAAAAREFADAHGLLLVSIEDLAAHRRRIGDVPDDSPAVVSAPEPAGAADDGFVLDRAALTELPTRYGRFRAIGYRRGGVEHIALVLGNPEAASRASAAGEGPAPLVRVHSECLTGDVFGSQRCDCGPQLDHALKTIAALGCGVVVYLRGQEGRGIGLASKLEAYALQDHGADTVDANTRLGLPIDARSYAAAADILRDLGVGRVRLLTNNPEKTTGLTRHGIEVAEQVATPVFANPFNARYLATKRDRMGHVIGAFDIDSIEGVTA